MTWWHVPVAALLVTLALVATAAFWFVVGGNTPPGPVRQQLVDVATKTWVSCVLAGLLVIAVTGVAAWLVAR